MFILMRYYEVLNDPSLLVNFFNRMTQPLFSDPVAYIRHFIRKNTEIKRFLFKSLSMEAKWSEELSKNISR